MTQMTRINADEFMTSVLIYANLCKSVQICVSFPAVKHSNADDTGGMKIKMKIKMKMRSRTHSDPRKSAKSALSAFPLMKQGKQLSLSHTLNPYETPPAKAQRPATARESAFVTTGLAWSAT